MKPSLGETRTVIAARHALIAPDGHVPSPLPDFHAAIPFVLIAPPLSFSFAQINIRFSEGGRATFPADADETALYVQSGSCTISIGADCHGLDGGGFAFSPAGQQLTINSSDAVVTCFRKKYHPLGEIPPVVVGNAADVVPVAFLGNPQTMLKTLLPDDLRFDMAMNVFTFEPGAGLPFVETHVMEHGLLMLSGKGIYQLDSARYAVAADDVIWMAPWCPQWFRSEGDQPASYLYYKDINRHPVLK